MLIKICLQREAAFKNLLILVINHVIILPVIYCIFLLLTFPLMRMCILLPFLLLKAEYHTHGAYHTEETIPKILYPRVSWCYDAVER